MTHWLALTALLLGTSQPETLKTRVSDAAILDSGIALVVREGTIEPGEHTYKLDVTPEALDGTLWYGSPDGAKIGDFTTTLRYEKRIHKREAVTVLDFVEANVGKTTTLFVTSTDGKSLTEIKGKIVKGDGGSASIMTEGGLLRTINLASVAQIDTKGLATTVEKEYEAPIVEIRFATKASEKARIQIAALEPGAGWEGTSVLELSGIKNAKVVSKAQLVLGGLKFEETNVRLLSGIPALANSYSGALDAATGSNGLAEFLAKAQPAMPNARNEENDPYHRLAEILAKMASVLASGPIVAQTSMGGYGGGGFGGVGYGGVGGRGMAGRGYADAVGEGTQTRLQRIESTHIYDFGKITLEAGGRITRILAKADATYESLVIAGQTLQSDWHQMGDSAGDLPATNVLRVQNNDNSPLLGGPCLVIKDGVPLAKLVFPFTGPKAEATIDLGAANDLKIEKSFQVTGRKESPTTSPGWVSIKTTGIIRFSIRNYRDEKVKLELASVQSGEPVEPGGARIVQLPSVRNDLTPAFRAIWVIELAPNEKKDVSITLQRTDKVWR
jgi:hypothetical protein